MGGVRSRGVREQLVNAYVYMNNRVHSALQITEREREQRRKEETPHAINKIKSTTVSGA